MRLTNGVTTLGMLGLALCAGQSGCRDTADDISLGRNEGGSSTQGEPAGAASGASPTAEESGGRAGGFATDGSSQAGATDTGGSLQAGATDTGGSSQAGTAGTGGKPSRATGGSSGTGGSAGGQTGGEPGVCDLPMDTGLCRAAMPRYFFDSASGRCVPFTYGGCDGNANNFETFGECQRACGGPGQCQQPLAVGACTGEVRRYYFDPDSRRCFPFLYRGCEGSANNFETLADCEAACTVNPCAAEPTAEACDLTVMSYYFDQDSGTCRAYDSTTCGVGSNKFSSPRECEARCSRTCVVAATASLPCCNDPAPLLASEVAEDDAWILNPLLSFPEECDTEDCHQDPAPSRVAVTGPETVDPPSCEYGDECRTADDCALVLDHAACCPCPQAIPKLLLGTDPCVVPVSDGDALPAGCHPRSCPENPCAACQNRVTACESQEAYRVCTVR